jgi:hypothetical protein
MEPNMEIGWGPIFSVWFQKKKKRKRERGRKKRGKRGFLGPNFINTVISDIFNQFSLKLVSFLNFNQPISSLINKLIRGSYLSPTRYLSSKL